MVLKNKEPVNSDSNDERYLGTAEHQSYLNWTSLQLAETGLALVEACIDGLQADACAQ